MNRRVDDHVHSPLKIPVASIKPTKSGRSIAQQLGAVAHQVVALISSSHVEQCHSAVAIPRILCSHGAHHGKVQQGVHRSLRSRTDQHHGRFPLSRGRLAMRLSRSAPGGFEHALGHGHQGTGVACTDTMVSAAPLLTEIQGHACEFFQGARSAMDRLFAHAHDLGEHARNEREGD